MELSMVITNAYFLLQIFANGPAVGLSKRYPTKHPGTCPGTLAEKLSRCKEGMADFLPSGYKVF
jgi:hypothetical protein